MASSIVETQVTWAAAASVTVTSATVVQSDAITLNIEDWDASVQISADNAGSPASGDVCDVYVLWSNGDVLSDGGDDFDTAEHAQLLGRLNTFTTDTPGEDPARKTFVLEASGKKALKLAVSCPQAASRSIVVRARMLSHRPQ
jgi:hypothetical protein